jgi:DNA end-binding protein Ku
MEALKRSIDSEKGDAPTKAPTRKAETKRSASARKRTSGKATAGRTRKAA